MDPLTEWRLLDLEASLKRAQHRFSEALDLLERARAACGTGTLGTARILVIKSHIFEQTGDFAKALAALEEAAPAIEEAGDSHLMFALHFNRAANLRHLQH